MKQKIIIINMLEKDIKQACIRKLLLEEESPVRTETIKYIANCENDIDLQRLLETLEQKKTDREKMELLRSVKW